VATRRQPPPAAPSTPARRSVLAPLTPSRYATPEQGFNLTLTLTRLVEARQYKQQLTELQNELRMERMQRDTQAVSLHDTQGRLHAADAAELASLRQQRDETARARAETGQQFIELAQERERDRVEKERLEEQVRAAHSLSGDWLAEQNLQLRQITQLQLVQAELQTELARKEEQLDAARLLPLHPIMHLLHLLHPMHPMHPSSACKCALHTCAPPRPTLLPLQMRQGIYPVPGASSGGAGAAYSPGALYAPPPPLAAAALAAATAPRAPSPPPRRRAPPPPAPTTSTPPSRSLLGMLGFGGGGGGGDGGEREAELNEQLESKDSANLALQVQLANLKGALRSQEEMTRGLLQNAHSPGGDNGPLSARGHLLIKHQNQNDAGWGFG
jgi:hypothetical protein